MKIEDYKLERGIRVNTTKVPAHNGAPRSGIIRKALKMHTPATWGKGNYSIIGLEIDTNNLTVRVNRLKGSDPYFEQVIYALLGDRDVRRLIKVYQERGRKDLYKLWVSDGVSGRMDVFMTYGFERGSFSTTKTIKLCHISCYGKINEGFGDDGLMYVGDLVEMAVYYNLTKDMRVRELRKKSKAKYIVPRFAEELIGFTTNTTKLL